MYSLAFPNIFNSSQTLLYNDYEATLTNLKLLIKSHCGELFGDPHFGNNLDTFIYENNSTVLRDLIIDDIYVAIQKFMPQIDVQRKNITVIGDDTKLSVSIIAVNRLDKTTNLYEIQLTEDTE